MEVRAQSRRRSFREHAWSTLSELAGGLPILPRLGHELFCNCFSLGLLLSVATAIPAAEMSALRDGDKTKVDCLFCFFDFINWPAQALPPSSRTVTIGILGQNRFTQALKSRSTEKTLNGQTIAI